MKKYQVIIEGATPYMQHRMDDVKLDQWEKLRGPIHERPEVAHEDAVRAEYHCYRNKDGQCYIPSDHIRGALIAAGSFVKAKVGGRSKSMKTIVAAMFMPSPEEILLPDYDTIEAIAGIKFHQGFLGVVQTRVQCVTVINLSVQNADGYPNSQKTLLTDTKQNTI